MNYTSEELQKVLPPTDTRNRSDLRFFEEGEIEQSEQAKNKIEEKQRHTRKLIEEGQVPQWKPRFFREARHPFLNEREEFERFNNEDHVIYELIQGEEGYWERRARGDWSSSPDLW